MQKGNHMSLLIVPLTSPGLKLANSVSTSGFPKLQRISRRLPGLPVIRNVGPDCSFVLARGSDLYRPTIRGTVSALADINLC